MNEWRQCLAVLIICAGTFGALYFVYILDTFKICQSSQINNMREKASNFASVKFSLLEWEWMREKK